MEKKKNLAASVRAKLANQAKETGENLQNLFIRFANERFLYRLNQTKHTEKFLLKGAALFAFWFDKPHRPTRDMDLLGSGKNDIPTLENIIREVCEIEEDDGLDFLPATVKGGLIREEEEYQGVRVTLIAMLERARIPVQIDIGFGDAVTPQAEETELKTILNFPPPRIRIYPKETVVAEKFEAMVKLGIGNGRMKDFWDLRYLTKEFEFEGDLVQQAIKRTFANRKTNFPEDLPVALSDDFAANPLKLSLWGGFVYRNGITIETDLAEVVKNLREFFLPIIEAEIKNYIFNQTWSPGIGWQEQKEISG